MENPFKNFTNKDYLYIAGAVASLVAIALVFKNKSSFGSGTISDTPNQAFVDPPGASVSGVTPGYTNYNMPPITPVALVPPEDTPAGKNGCGCPSAYGCAGPSQLDDGSAYTGLGQLLSFYRDTNPVYQQAQQAQLQTYAAYFNMGETYSAGALPVTVPNN
jgi:hypothetical protein